MSLLVNQRSYPLPQTPVVVVCVDGCEPDYIAQAVASGHMPWMKNILQQGTAIVADCVVPTFTNPNNVYRDRRTAQRARHLRQFSV